MRTLAICVLSACLGIAGCSSSRSAVESSNAAALPNALLQERLSDTAGGSLVLGDELATGKTVTLVFWQAWCPSCRTEAPELVAASREYPNLEIIGVVSGPDESVDAAELERAITELRLPYRNVRDRTLELTRALAVRGTPTIVVLDAQGRTRYRGHKAPDWGSLLR